MRVKELRAILKNVDGEMEVFIWRNWEMAEHYCQINIGPVCTSFDDPRYRPCGKPACTKENGMWLCADHYDKFAALDYDRDLLFGAEEEL